MRLAPGLVATLIAAPALAQDQSPNHIYMGGDQLQLTAESAHLAVLTYWNNDALNGAGGNEQMQDGDISVQVSVVVGSDEELRVTPQSGCIADPAGVVYVPDGEYVDVIISCGNVGM